jgi:lactobin A/cerein 7B family class IIb bacteriocin
MRELTKEETQQINGGRLKWGAGAAAVLTLSMWSPVTFAFGLPIAAGMYTVAAFTDK